MRKYLPNKIFIFDIVILLVIILVIGYHFYSVFKENRKKHLPVLASEYGHIPSGDDPDYEYGTDVFLPDLVQYDDGPYEDE